MKVGDEMLYVAQLWVLNAPWTLLPGKEEVLGLRRTSNPLEKCLTILLLLLNLTKLLRPLVALLASGRN